MECTSADDETVSLDSRRLEVSYQFCGNRQIFLIFLSGTNRKYHLLQDPDIGQPDKQPGNIVSIA